MRTSVNHLSAGRLTANVFLAALTLSCAFTPATAIHHVENARQAAGLAVLPPGLLPGDAAQPLIPPASRKLDFKLKHIFHHGTWRYPTLHRRLDVPSNARVWMTSDESLDSEPMPQLRVQAQTVQIQRLVDRRPEAINAMLDQGRMTGKAMALGVSAWTVDDMPGPNVTDKETLLSFARMASNAYILEPRTGEWEDVGGGFNYTEDFGWESDGLRGHIFADMENATVVIGLKGTSPAVFDGSDTTTNDKINDNLFFGCCCGQGGQFLWRQVCDCQTSAYSCNSTCLVMALKEKNRYYYAVQDLYHNVTELYPNADIWVTGHSLGGATISLLGLTYGLPAVTFEAPGEALPAVRLNLPTPPGYSAGYHQQRDMTGGWHFGHTADPIFMGTCNSANSFCTLAGYAMQSRCHTGLTCTYDTVGDLGWRVGIGTHKIRSVIKDVIEKYAEPAACEPMVNCTDCYPWEFYESNGTDSTTTSSSSSSTTKTRTQTCKTPGWWGCLDESTTSGPTTTSESTTTITSTTCLTPGWFGCKDERTTTLTSTSTIPPAPAPTATTTTSSPTSTGSTSCNDPGWFGGCYDPTSTVISTSTRTKTLTITSGQKTPTTTENSATTCTSEGFLGLICLDPSPTASHRHKHKHEHSPKPTSTHPSGKKSKCLHRNLFGWCVEWEDRWRVDL